MTRWISLGDQIRNFGPRKPGWQLSIAVAIPLTALRSRNAFSGYLPRQRARVFVAILLRQVNKLPKRHHFDAEFRFELLDQFLGGVRLIKRVSFRVVTRARMISPDDHV